MNDDNLHRALGRLEGEMTAMRTKMSGIDSKLDKVVEQTATIKAERNLERKRHTRVIALVTTIGTFVGAVVAKLSGHA
jgi:hypothetical protein